MDLRISRFLNKYSNMYHKSENTRVVLIAKISMALFPTN